MKICPKCSFPSESTTECTKCGVQFSDIRKPNRPERIPRVNCGWAGCVVEATSRHLTPTGWLNICDEHYVIYWKPKGTGLPNGWADSEEVKRRDPTPTYRQRWYAERGLPYEPPRKSSSNKLAGWTALHGHAPRMREPGED